MYFTFDSGTLVGNLGHNTSDFRFIQYSNYDKLVDKYRIVLRGYPLTPEGNILRPSDFPGIKALQHADDQLGKGAWGFEKVTDALYNKWKAECDRAKSNGQPALPPPYIPVPDTDFRGSSTNAKGSSSKCTAGSEPGQDGTMKKTKRAAGKNQGAKNKYKSKELIDDSDEEEEIGWGSNGGVPRVKAPQTVWMRIRTRATLVLGFVVFLDYFLDYVRACESICMFAQVARQSSIKKQ